MLIKKEKGIFSITQTNQMTIYHNMYMHICVCTYVYARMCMHVCLYTYLYARMCMCNVYVWHCWNLVVYISVTNIVPKLTNLWYLVNNNIPSFCIKTKPLMDGADATLYARFSCTYAWYKMYTVYSKPHLLYMYSTL